MEAPVRNCCMTRHWGAVCPDGMVMCCICFDRFLVEDLAKDQGEVTDVCIRCAPEAGLDG